MLAPVIRKLESFGPIKEDDRNRLAQIIAKDARKVAARTDLISEGDNPTCAHLLTAGLACRYKLLKGGKRQIVAYLVPGDFCDLHTFIMKSTDHSIATIVPSEVVEISKEHVEEIFANPSLTKPMLMSTLVDEATLRAWITRLGQLPAAQRTAHFFCELHARLKLVGLTEAEGAFQLPVTQHDLADTLGLSLVHTNRSLRDLKAANLISVKGRHIAIPDVRKLETFCSFKSNYLHMDEG